MKRVERLAEEWLKANDWDYQKYGDRRADRSAYDSMMNYEISGVLDDAFQAGYRQALGDAAKVLIREINDLTPAAAVVFIQQLADAPDENA